MTSLINLLNNVSMEDLKERGLNIKTDGNLYMVLYDKEKEIDDVSRVCRGIILEKETNRVMCYTFDKGVDGSMDWNIDDCEFEESVDGTQIRLFWNGDRWQYATTRCIDAFRAYWYSTKSFGELFDEAATSLDLERLDKRCCYAFVLCHPGNRIVTAYNRPHIIHVMTRNLDTLEEVRDDDIGIIRPRKLSFTTKEELENYLMTDKVLNEGVMVRNKLTGERNKQIKVVYEMVKKLRGNVRDMTMRFFELLQEGILSIFLYYYPEYSGQFTEYHTQYLQIMHEVQRSYFRKMIRRDWTMLNVRYEYRPLVSELHELYKKTHKRTDLNVVGQYLLGLPVQRLMFVYNNRFKDCK